MTAGRELDALIAEKVMGWKVFRNGEHGPHRWEAETDRGTLRVIDSSYSGDGFSPSTDIAAAWEVVEKVRKEAGDFQLALVDYGSAWAARFDKASAVERTAPHAICLAALKAVGVEVPA